jgi:leucyl/phenylalanyl-tRNA--protein transferase
VVAKLVGCAMRVSRFPDPREATVEGVVAVGGDLQVETLLDAYAHGIFPWPQEGYPLLWFSPAERGIIDLRSELRAPERFLRTWQRAVLGAEVEIRVNSAFREVMESCRDAQRPGQAGTWILPPMLPAYVRLHELGAAHCVEAWRGQQLIGGVYGVWVDGVFSGESMFHRERDAGKLALWALLLKLREAGCAFLDVQMVTPVVESFGGVLWPREKYLGELAAAQLAWREGKIRCEWKKGVWSPSATN